MDDDETVPMTPGGCLLLVVTVFLVVLIIGYSVYAGAYE